MCVFSVIVVVEVWCFLERSMEVVEYVVGRKRRCPFNDDDRPLKRQRQVVSWLLFFSFANYCSIRIHQYYLDVCIYRVRIRWLMVSV